MDPELAHVAAEIEQHVAREGWDQPTRLFAIVRTSDVRATNPELVLHDAHVYTSVEQDLSDSPSDLEELLATVAWPADVIGAAVVVERLVLPSGAESDLADDESVAIAAAEHPERHDVRMVGVVLRTGAAVNALRFKSHDDDASVAIAADLVPQLNDAVRATFD